MKVKNSFYIFKKDWQEIYKNKEILLPIIILPILFSIIFPILLIGSALLIPSEELNNGEGLADLIPFFQGQENEVLKIIIYYNTNFLMKPLFLFTPMILTMVVASDSFAGEKERKTIESLLILPITDKELILGKVLTAFIPAIIATWAAFGAFQALIFFMTYDIIGFNLIGLDWYLLLFLFTPLLSFFSVIIMIISSSRAKDAKSAQNVAVIIILPVISLFFLQMTNLFVLNIINILILSAFMGFLDLLMIHLGGKQLNRDRLISRIR